MHKRVRTKESVLLGILFALALLASIDGVVLTYDHFAKTSDSLCASLGGSFDCDRVNHSPYSTVDNIFYFLAIDLGWSVPIITIGIPIAVMAIAVFLFIKLSVFHILRRKHLAGFHPEHQMWIIRGVLAFSFIYGMWLFYIQAHILKAFCVYCLGLDTLIFLSLITSFLIDAKELRTAAN